MRTRVLWLCVLGVAAILIGAGARAGEEKKAPNCISDAKKGEWVLYEMPNNIQQKQTVTEVTEEEVSVTYETIMNGKSLSSTVVKIPLKGKGDKEGQEGAVKPKIYEETIKIKIGDKEKELACTVVEMEVNGQVSKTYFSQEIPVSGMVKSQLGETVNLQVKDCGTAAAE